MRKLKGPLTSGARNLHLYLAGKHPDGPRTTQSVPDFCAAHGLQRLAVQRALNGERQKYSVDFAKAIEEATGGVVRWHEWTRADRSASPEKSHAA